MSLYDVDVHQCIVKDLWALRLQTLRNRVSYESDHEAETRSSQVFSSQSESEPATETQSQSQGSRRSSAKNVRSRAQPPNLIETLSMCYIGALLLRIPLTVADIHSWTNAGELPYYRSPREVPLGMRERLPALYHDFLEPQEVLSPRRIHQSVAETLTLLDGEFGMATPPINISLVLYRWIEVLALPLEVFTAAKRLMRILGIDGDFSPSSSSIVLRYPEARLMAVLVIATKLLLPFDKIDRKQKSSTDLPTLSMDWYEWTKILRSEADTHGNLGSLSFDDAFKFTEADCLEATDDTLDAYLDWYSDNLASEDIRERGQAGRDADFRRALFKIFALPSRVSTKQARPATPTGTEPMAGEKLRQVQSTLVSTQAIEDDQTIEDAPPPGSFYRRFKHIEELGGPVKIFYEKAAELAGVALDGIVQAVFLTEHKLQKHEEGLRKAAVGR